jgi:tRNA-2-methylthio-N6-dimethylallyladenosine synthase
VTLQEEISWDEHKKQNGAVVEVLVAEGEGRKDAATHRLSGRARDNRLVHFVPDSGPQPRPGDIVTTRVTSAAPHYLRADELPLSLRRTRAGDAWAARQLAASSPAAAEPAGGPAPVLLGMPAVRA